jgi:hypothetical protein
MENDGHTAQTCEQNLECLCRCHHRMKHHQNWAARINGSDIEWTTPTGHHHHHYTTTAYGWRDYTPVPNPTTKPPNPPSNPFRRPTTSPAASPTTSPAMATRATAPISRAGAPSR